MSKEKRRVPKLRFPGFAEDWEQRKLSELATMNARIGWQNLRTSEFLDNGDYLLITGTDFDNGRIKYSTCHYVEKKRFDQDTKIQLSTGSILITKDGTLGKVALVEELPKPATLNAGVFNVRVKDDAFLSYKYLYHYLKAPFLMKYVTANATGGTIKHLNQSILVDFPIPITEKQEQDRIAKLLDSLESIITLHQRKLNNLKLKKKALLQKLFPKNGERYPELRFPGFTDAWEQRKFGDLFEYERPDAYIVKSDNYNDDFNMPVLTANKAFILGYTNEENSYNKPSIIFDDFTLDRKYVDFPYMLKSSAIKILTSKNQHNLRFLFERLNSTRFELLGHARHYISVVQNTITFCPSVEEEVCISNLLTKFDELITLHQRKLDHLQLQKKALLQQMFV